MDHQDDVVSSLAVHEAVGAERWKQANTRLARIEAVPGAIVLLLLLWEGSVVTVIKRLAGP
jgi:hypothetical protein